MTKPHRQVQPKKDGEKTKEVRNGVFVGAALSAVVAAAPSLALPDRRSQEKISEHLVTKEDVKRLRKKRLLRLKARSAVNTGAALGALVGVAATLPQGAQREVSVLMVKRADVWNLAVGGVEVDENALSASDEPESLEAVIEPAVDALQKFRERQMKIKTKDGKERPISEIINDSLDRVRQYTRIGNIMVQSDPEFAAIVWGAFNFVLQVVGNDAEKTAKAADMMNDVLEIVETYRPYAEHYRYSVSKSGRHAYRQILRLYGSIQEFCVRAKRYYLHSRARRIAGAVVEPYDIAFGSLSRDITKHVEEVKKAVDAAEFDNKKRLKILNWLSKVSYTTYHSAAVDLRHPNTCEWLLRKAEYIEWKVSTDSCLLWLHGNPGSGKSLLMSKIIDDLQPIDTEKTPVTYFYCSYRDEDTQHAASILASILKQLCAKMDSIPGSIVSAFGDQERNGLLTVPPTLSEVRNHIMATLNESKCEALYIVIDGLDELLSEERAEIFRALFELVEHDGYCVKIVLSSRYADDIQQQLRILRNFPHIFVENTDTRRDIEEYVRQEIRRSVDEGQRFWRSIKAEPGLADTIVERLTSCANGMFLWVHMQIAALRKEVTASAIREALERLPTGMEEMYTRIFEKLSTEPESNQRLVTRSISWVLCASRPLLAEELTESLAMDTNEKRIKRESRVEPETILDVCLNLLVLEKHGENSYFRLVHFSVQEFIYDRLGRLGTNFRILDEDAHKEVLEVSMTYLTSSEISRGPWEHETLYECQDDFESYTKTKPFLQYASSSWAWHVKQIRDPEGRKRAVIKVADFLTRKSKSALSFQVFWFQKYINGFPLDTTPLHIASFFGVSEVLQYLLEDPETKLDVDALDSTGRTPLHWAAMNGHLDVLRVLFQRNASPNIVDKNQRNPMALAALSGHAYVVQFLLNLQKSTTGAEKEQLRIALFAASEAGRIDIVQTLLDAGADPNLHGDDTLDPVFVAARKDNPAVIEVLLDAGAKVDSGREYGNALQAAAAASALDAARLLLERGADVNAMGGGSGTALNAAAYEGNYEMVSMLLEAGAIIRQQGDVFGGALTIAESTGSEKVVELLRQQARKRGIDEHILRTPSSANAFGGSKHLAQIPTANFSLDAMKVAAKPLIIAFRLGHLEMANSMLQKAGALLNVAVENNDLDFLDRFNQLNIFMAERMLKIKNSDVISILYSFFQKYHAKVQESPNRDSIMTNSRRATARVMQILLGGGYYPMVRGMILVKEKELLETVRRKDLDEAEALLGFVRAWLWKGMLVRGHSLVLHGFAMVYMKVFEAAEKDDVARLLKLFESDIGALGSELLPQPDFTDDEQRLIRIVELWQAANAMGLGDFVEKLRDSVAGFKAGKDVHKDVLERVEMLRNGTVNESWRWDDDSWPWWETARVEMMNGGKAR